MVVNLEMRNKYHFIYIYHIYDSIQLDLIYHYFSYLGFSDHNDALNSPII